ncbi:MAG TPA: hypothetical protein VII06_27395 [Chloroflexota bacterium]|jgi:hypothetical protein
MNLFRSEEHARNWVGYNPDFAETLQPLSYWMERFAGDNFRFRVRPDYITWRVARRPPPPPA